MNKKLSLTVLFLLMASLCFAQPEAKRSDVLGLDWLQKSIGERMECVMFSMFVLTKSGVELTQSPNDYYDMVDRRLKTNQKLYSSTITDILASAIYENEPQTRDALDKLRPPKEVSNKNI